VDIGLFKPKVNVKKNTVKRWHQPDKRFFACGACQILAHAFLEIYTPSKYQAVWVKPAEGFNGNHVFVTDGENTFDYHGYSTLDKLKAHSYKRNEMYYPGWSCEFIKLKVNLNSRETHEIGMFTLMSTEFLYDALPRAREFVERHQHRHVERSA
jgi:hypothetical protein